MNIKGKDMTVPCAEGLINIRVGAIIKKDNKILLVGDDVSEGYLFTVGGRIQFGETSEEAMVREVFEETGVKMEIDRLGFIQENYFFADTPQKEDKLVYEIDYYYYMKVPEDFEPSSMEFMEEEQKAQLHWVDIDGPQMYYPTFFREELRKPQQDVKYILTDERPKQRPFQY